MPKFSLQVTPAVKVGKYWEVTALGKVLYGNNPPDPPEEVVFEVNGEEFQRVETNSQTGVASSVIPLRSGSYVIAAYRSSARGEARNQRVTIHGEKKLTKAEKETEELKAKKKLADAKKELKEAIEGKPKIAKNVLVSVSGMPGKQKFLISIAVEDGTFIPNQPFTIVDGDRVVRRKTSRKGVAIYKANFAEHSRYFEVRVGNTKDLVWQEHVPGSAKRVLPEFRQAPAPPDYSQMGREAARRHFRK